MTILDFFLYSFASSIPFQNHLKLSPLSSSPLPTPTTYIIFPIQLRTQVCHRHPSSTPHPFTHSHLIYGTVSSISQKRGALLSVHRQLHFTFFSLLHSYIFQDNHHSSISIFKILTPSPNSINIRSFSTLKN